MNQNQGPLGISIRAKTFLSETETFFVKEIQIFVMFSHLLG